MKQIEYELTRRYKWREYDEASEYDQKHRNRFTHRYKESSDSLLEFVQCINRLRTY